MKEYDLVVAGGGQAGACAAISAAEEGLKVLLIEASGALGGSAVTALVNPFMPFSATIEENGEKRIIRLSDGIFSRIFDALKKDGIHAPECDSHAFHEETLKILLDRMCAKAGVDVLFHATLSSVAISGGKVESVTVATIAGPMAFRAKTFIDATGDATLCALARLPFRLGRDSDSLCQPMTLCFRVAGIKTDDYWKHHREINALYKKLKSEGKISNPREDVLVFGTRIPDILHFNTTRVVKHDPTDPFSVSKAEAIAREQVLEMMEFLRSNFDFCKNAMLLSTASTIGVRESRMIEARHVLCAEEIVAGTHFEDGIAAGNYDIDIHSPDGSGTSHYYFPEGVYYTIPYRSMLPKDAENLIVAGRCIGATHEAQASIRIMPICCCLGEAAGVAAAIASETGSDAARIDAALLRERLLKRGAFIG